MCIVQYNQDITIHTNVKFAAFLFLAAKYLNDSGLFSLQVAIFATQSKNEVYTYQIIHIVGSFALENS